METIAEVPLIGAGGERVDIRRTLASHGVAMLAPQSVDLEAGVLETTLIVNHRVRTITIREASRGRAAIQLASDSVDAEESHLLVAAVRHILRLDEDLSPFYALAKDDPALAWATSGAGRMLRSPTVFEDVVKTICTTNCSWSATVRMNGALVSGLGALSPDGRHAFPTPAAMASAGADFYHQVARAGYRSSYLVHLARETVEGRLDLEELNDPDLPDGEVERRLLAIPGVGPYSAAHIMLIALGRYRRPVLDSWTKPAYARRSGGTASPAVIGHHFGRYGRYAGLAFWLFLTRDWVDD